MKLPGWARTPLPLVRTHGPRVEAPGRPEAWTRTVLLVEDNAYLAAMTEMLLETLGYNIKYAAQAQQALDMLTADGGVDAVFTDILMPGGMNGIDFAKLARARLRDLPIILTTGSPLAAADARAQGFTVLERPCPVDVLESTLRSMLALSPYAVAEATAPSEVSAAIVPFDRRRAVA
jgi:CheY-like chemotaxis protein